MTRTRFAQYLAYNNRRIEKLFAEKNEEYGEDSDVFMNFDVSGEVLREVGIKPWTERWFGGALSWLGNKRKMRQKSALAALLGYVLKHITSVFQFVYYGQKLTTKQIIEKVNDILLYLQIFLFMALDQRNTNIIKQTDNKDI